MISWHEILAYEYFEHFKQLLNEIRLENSSDSPFCEARVQGKQCRNPFQESKSRFTEVCNITHAYFRCPMEVAFYEKSCYIFLLKDKYTNFRQVHFLKNKYQMYIKLSELILMCKKQKKKKQYNFEE